MKSTRYFDDYQSAYNYYGGNVVPSTEIALIGEGSYIFVSSDNAVSGNQQYFDVSMTNDEIVDTMTYTAYNNGVSYGEAVGFETGYTAGTTYGEAIGYAQGYSAGEEAGYEIGYTAGVDSVPTPTGNINITNTSQTDVTAYATAQVVDANLIAGNIVSGVSILGVTGSYQGGTSETIIMPSIYEPNYYEMPLTIEILDSDEIDDTTLSFNDEFYVYGTDTGNGVSMLCSKNGGSWEALEFDSTSHIATIDVAVGDILQFKVHKEALRSVVPQGFTRLNIGTKNSSYYSMPFNVYGNLKSVMKEEFVDENIFGTYKLFEGDYTFSSVLSSNILDFGYTVIDASSLVLPLVVNSVNGEIYPSSKSYVYSRMFRGCIYLLDGPTLPNGAYDFINDDVSISINGDHWFEEMFYNCKSLCSAFIPRYLISDQTTIFNNAFYGVCNLSLMICKGIYEANDFVACNIDITYDLNSSIQLDIVTDPDYDVSIIFDENSQYQVTENRIEYDFDANNGDIGFDTLHMFDIYGAILTYNNGYNIGFDEGEASGGGTEWTDDDRDMVAYGTLANELLVCAVDPPVVYKQNYSEIDAEQMLYCIEEFGNQFMNTVWFDKWTAADGFESDLIDEINTDNSSYIYWQGSLAEGDKVGFSLVPATTNGNGDNALDSDCYFNLNASDPDQPITHWYTAPFDADWKLLIEIGSDQESGDHTIEISFEEVP